jgi:hypothetical protein
MRRYREAEEREQRTLRSPTTLSTELLLFNPPPPAPTLSSPLFNPSLFKFNLACCSNLLGHAIE